MDNNQKKTKKTKRTRGKTVLFTFALILAFLAVPLSSLLWSGSLYAWGIRVACSPRNMSVPDNYEIILSSTVMLEGVSYESCYSDGYADIISPAGNTEKLPLVLYIHGGYYVGGDKASAEAYCRVIASKGFIVANINYALAPGVRYPGQILQTDEALRFFTVNAGKFNIDPDKIFIGGDSAGGHLSSQMGAVYTNTEFAAKIGLTSPAIKPEQLKGLLLLCGFYNSYTVLESGFPFLKEAMWLFTGRKNFLEFSGIGNMNTVEHVTSGYPAVFITCGDADPLFFQTEEMVSVLNEKGVPTAAYLPLSRGNKLKHEFQRDFSLEECNNAMTVALEFLLSNR